MDIVSPGDMLILILNSTLKSDKALDSNILLLVIFFTEYFMKNDIVNVFLESHGMLISK